MAVYLRLSVFKAKHANCIVLKEMKFLTDNVCVLPEEAHSICGMLSIHSSGTKYTFPRSPNFYASPFTGPPVMTELCQFMFRLKSGIWPFGHFFKDINFKFVLPSISIKIDRQTKLEVNRTQNDYFSPLSQFAFFPKCPLLKVF